MAPRARFELATLRLTAERPTSSELAGVGANRGNSASCDETGRITFSFFVPLSFAFSRDSSRLLLRSYARYSRSRAKNPGRLAECHSFAQPVVSARTVWLFQRGAEVAP